MQAKGAVWMATNKDHLKHLRLLVEYTELIAEKKLNESQKEFLGKILAQAYGDGYLYGTLVIQETLNKQRN